MTCATIHIKEQYPAEGILQTAKDNGCDLIVMASHGRHGPRGNGLAVTSGPQLPEQSTPTDPDHAGHIVSIEFTLAQHLTGSGDLGRSHFSVPATDPAFCFGRRQASSGSPQHEVALKQRDGVQYIEHQLAGAPLCREPVLRGHEVDAAGVDVEAFSVFE
jgi:universal stress protein family protein